MGNITKNYYGHSQSHDIEVNVSMSVDEILELQRRSARGMSAGTELSDAEVKEIRELVKELQTDKAKKVLDKLQHAGYLDDYYTPVNLSMPQVSVLAYNASEKIWGCTRWKPFEDSWCMKNLKTYYQTALSQKQTLTLMDELKEVL